MSALRGIGWTAQRVACAAMAACAAWGVSPALNEVRPRGGQLGTEVEATFLGENLDDAVDLLFHDPGVSLVRLEAVDAKTVKAVLAIAPDCPLGLKGVRVRTRTGLSNPRTFSVGRLPETTETEPNNSPDTAHAVSPNTTVNGVITLEDVDYFAVELAAGARLAVEVEAIRLGVALFDPKLRIFGPRGHELATEDDTSFARQDAALVFVAEEAGRHLVAVSEASYLGGGDYGYRLHIGDFPRPQGVTPMGGPPGAEIDVTWLGDAAIGGQRIVVPDGAGTLEIYPATEGGAAPTPLRFRVGNLPGVIESEPNNSREQATEGSVPGAFDGVLGGPGDVDWFAFDGKQGQEFTFRVWARELGSPVDSVINIQKPDGQRLDGNDDGEGLDSRVRITLPEDGRYAFLVRDHLRRGGATYSYRVEATASEPALTLTAAQNRNVMLSVPRGNRALLLISANRAGFGGDVAVTFRGLPDGAAVEHGVLAARESVLPVIVSAGVDAPLAGALLAVEGRFADDTRTITGGLNQDITLIEGQNQTIFDTRRVDRLAMAVTEPAPFEVRVVETKAPVVRGARKHLRVTAIRAEGFTAPINVYVPFLPGGFGAGQVDIPENQTEADLVLEAKGDAPLGELPVVVQGASAGWLVCSPFAPIQVEAPWVTFAVANVEAEQGASAEAVVTLSHARDYEGKFTAELQALPKGVTTTPLEFDRNTTELRFPLSVAPDAPEGKHEGLYVTATLSFEGEPIQHVSGSAQLTIYKPLPPELQAPPAPPREEAPAPEAPQRRTRFPGST